MLWVEYIGSRRIVDDNGIFQVSANLRQVLDVVALVVVTALPEQPMVDHFVDVQLIQ